MRFLHRFSARCLGVVCLNFALSALAPAAELTIRAHEGDKTTPLPCRAWVVAGGKRLFQPTTPSCTTYERDRSFSCDGEFSIDAPPGPAIVHVERGKEYTPVNQPLTVKEGQTTTATVTLHRWIDMNERGWRSADMHVHFTHDDRHIKNVKRLPRDLHILKQMALADDVNFMPAFSYWNDNVPEWPAWPDGPIVHADAAHLVTLANEEIERIASADGVAWESVGAPLFYGLSKPVYVPRMEKHYPCDAVLCRLARKTTPGCLIDLDKALWAENVVGVALGLFDSMQLCHNHYHRDKTFRMGWGMIGPELETSEHDWGKSEMLYRTNLLYYHWLNCGFHLAATGGSAIGVMPVATGQSRTYAKLDGPLAQEDYFKAIKAGRTFATTGPMLFLTVNGQDVGSTIKWSAGDKAVVVKAVLESMQRIESLELIHNGPVFSKTDIAADIPNPNYPFSYSQQVDLSPQRSGWVAARAFFRVADGSLHQAHTSPVYITVDGQPTAFRKDAELMMQWIDRIVEVSNQSKRYNSEQDRAESQAIFREARAVYEGIARTAAEAWKD